MLQKHNLLTKPLLLATLISAAFSAQAANREVLKTAPGNSGAHAQAGLNASELKAERGMSYANGLNVTRHQQMHQGVPVWNEVVVEHKERGGKSYFEIRRP